MSVRTLSQGNTNVQRSRRDASIEKRYGHPLWTRVNHWQKEVVAAVTFAITYVLISGRHLRFLPPIDQLPLLLGAVLMLAFGVMPPERAYRAVNYVANMIVVESAREHLEVGFWDYARFGIPITILTTVAGTAVLLVLH